MKRAHAWPVILAICCAVCLAAEQRAPATKKVWADSTTNLLGGLSPDGRLLSYADAATGDLAVYEFATGEKRSLVSNPEGAKTFAYFSAFSRDGGRIAYAWFNEQGYYELWTVGLDGAGSRRLYSNPETGFVQPCDWSLDGKQILTLFFRRDNVSQIALVSADDGSVRILKTLSWFYPKKISFSPDGRYILYDSLTGRDEVARDILLLSADGSSERPLIEDPANDIFPLWTPAGDGVVFASDRSGNMDLWLAAVRDGQLAGEPQPIARSLGRALPLGVAPDGGYYFGLRAGRSDVVTAPYADGLAGEPFVAGLRTIGRNSAPAWSHDNKRLAYLTQIGTENYGKESRGVAVWRLDSRQETLLVPKLAFISQLSWSPDDTRLLASGSDGRGRAGVFAIDPDSGAVSPLVRVAGGDPRGLPAAWIGVQSFVYVSRERRTLLRYPGPATSSAKTNGHGAEETALYAAPPGSKLGTVAADDSGEWLAFNQETPDGTHEVLAMRLNDGEIRKLMSIRNAAISALAWSGESLYVTTPSGDTPIVWRVSRDGGDPERTPIPAAADGPHFSTGGQTVAYVQNDQHAEVWRLDGWLPSRVGLPRSQSGEAAETPPSVP